MSPITIVLYTIVVIIALMLIGLILIQQSKGGGFGGALGGAGEAVFGAKAGTHITKLTVILTAAFFILILTLAVITGHTREETSEINDMLQQNETKTVEQDGLSEAENLIEKAVDKVEKALQHEEVTPEAVEQKTTDPKQLTK